MITKGKHRKINIKMDWEIENINDVVTRTKQQAGDRDKTDKTRRSDNER